MPQLRLIEIFASVQGETSFSGLPTTFIRLASCNLRCSWCDTSYSFGRGEARVVENIITVVETLAYKNVCVTGGEPLLQEEVYPFMEALCDRGFVVSLETGGSLDVSNVDKRVHIILDIKCPGSAMESKNYWPNLENLHPQTEIKFVLIDRADYDYAKEICTKYDLYKHEVLLSPVHGVLNPKLLVDWILDDHLPVRLNLQIHKWIWTPETRGV